MSPGYSYGLLIGDSWQPGTYESQNPYSGQTWAVVPDANKHDLNLAVRAARKALDGPSGAFTGFERTAHLRRLVDIARDAEQMAITESTDNWQATAGDARPAGKPACLASLLR